MAIDLDNLRELQLIELDILKEFIKICETHKLKYYANGGTALGAVRHQGFIPWDDDIDIAMPRKDYDKLLAIPKGIFPSHLEIATINSHDGFIEPCARIIDNRTKLTLTRAAVKRVSNVWIDILPLDGMPNSKIGRYIHVRASLFKRIFVHISVFREKVDQVKKRPYYQKCIIWFCNRFDLQKLFNLKRRFIACEKHNKKYSFYESAYCFSPWSHYHLKAVFKRKWFGDGKKMQFEDIEITVPEDYDKFLGQIMGSYMTLPPKNERVNHHGIEILTIEK